MLQYTSVLVVLLLMVIYGDSLRSYVNKSHPRPWKVIYYPQKTVFQKADLIDIGCVTFIKKCPRFYKRNRICARHYDGHYKTLDNYCEMEYENCNSWRRVDVFLNGNRETYGPSCLQAGEATIFAEWLVAAGSQ